jgi:hypothetical protein
MSHNFATLHNAHNRCINRIPSVLVNVLDNLFLLINRRQGYLTKVRYNNYLSNATKGLATSSQMTKQQNTENREYLNSSHPVSKF